MNNYVDIDLLIKKRHGCDRTCCDCGFYKDGDSWCEGEIYFIDILRQSKKTVEVKKVVHAKWNSQVYAKHECSACGFYEVEIAYDYCPHCGAKMDLE